ncbi:MAG: DNA-3-methyladenine glycosylase [Phycisphaerales bacterium]
MPRRPRRFSAWELGPEALARRLLGCTLVARLRGAEVRGVIVETEAYLGPHDRGSHTWAGRRTPRNESMHLPGGHAYVYRCYGVHWCLNVVAAPEGVGCAVLIRALDPAGGVRLMASRRPGVEEARLCAGPGRLCRALGITGALDGEDLRRSRRVFILDGTATAPVRASSRIGLGCGGLWARRRLRFSLAGHPAVSIPVPGERRPRRGRR